MGVGGDDHGVDVLVVEQLAEVAGGGSLAVAEPFADFVHPLGVHVADHHDPIARQRLEPRDHFPRPGAAADDAEVDRVVGRGFGVGGVQSRGRKAKGGRRGGGAEKLTAGRFLAHCWVSKGVWGRGGRGRGEFAGVARRRESVGVVEPIVPW